MEDQYFTIAAPSTGFFKDRSSKFFAYAYPVYADEDWQAALEELKKEHFKARHHCFAYRIGLDGNTFRANDDGEPSGSAGRPILGQIDRFNLTNVAVIVVRYFGGTKLGVSGLINAYRESAAEALRQADIIEKFVEDVYAVTFDYSQMNPVMNAVKKLDLFIMKQQFENSGYLEISIKQSEVADTWDKFKAAVMGISLEEAKQIEKMSGIKIEYLRTI